VSPEQEKVAVAKIAEAARAFVKCYDEFNPEYHGGSCGEHLDALFDACDEFGKVADAADEAEDLQSILPAYIG
jgi:hypothetical protein